MKSYHNVVLFACLAYIALGCSKKDGELDGNPDGFGDLCETNDQCNEGAQCLGGSCVAEFESPADLCGPLGNEVCEGEELCLSDTCVEPGANCEQSDQCEEGQFCEPTIGRCLPRSIAPACEFRPPVGEFTPTVSCRWEPPAGDPYEAYEEVVMTPSVLNMTDDNGDGRTDVGDIPDIVFVSFDRQADGCCTRKGVVRVVSGECNEDGTMNQLATIGDGDPWIDNSTGIALGNLHPDSNDAEHAPEIVATMQGGGSIAWRRTADDGSAWEVFWHNEDYPTRDHNGGSSQNHSGAQPSLVDLNGDGSPEVLIGNVVLNGQTGDLIWDGLQTVGEDVGIGNNAFLGPISTAADIDVDGDMEVIAGNTVYDHDGNEVWSYSFSSADNSVSSCGGRLACDGYNAVGNFDNDDEGEIVIVRRGVVFVLEHTGELKHRVEIPADSSGANEGGPPTIADFDGDGNPEIGIASRDYYVVFDFQCQGDTLPDGCESENVRWQVENDDDSSRVTGSSVFDFEGDGKAEVVYADETSFRIFDGTTGDILYEDNTHRSNTRLEMPVVVDVDNDGKSEVVIPEPNNGNDDRGGIEIWEDVDNNWVRTRRTWNQHSYHVSNITENGQVPRYESPNWLESNLNNFRQNVQPSGLFDAPDLVVQSVSVSCLKQGDISELVVKVANEGILGVAPGIFVQVIAVESDGNEVPAATGRTTKRLLSGQSEVVVIEWEVPNDINIDGLNFRAVVDSNGEGGQQYNECNEDNNEATSEAAGACSILE